MNRSMPFIALIVLLAACLCFTACNGSPGVASLPDSIQAGAVLGTTADEVAASLRSDFPDEFPALARAEKMDETEGLMGDITQFEIYDANGEMIGMVSVYSSTGEVSSIIYSPQQEEQVAAKPVGSVEDAVEIAKAYIAKWGFDLNDEYVLVEEYEHGNVYNIMWCRRFGEVFLTENFYVELNGVLGTVNMAIFPHSKSPLPQDVEELTPEISREEALEIAREQFLREGMLAVEGDWDVTEDAELHYQPGDGEARLMWQVEIMYEYYPPGAEMIPENSIDHMGGQVYIDAKSGEASAINPCR